MSEDTNNPSSCASCGIEECDDIKLKDCTACYLVKYCSIKCQKDHRKQHKEACKKRAAELRDELLFKQPESSHRGDCPICCLPLPLDRSNSVLFYCCSKFICQGCMYADAQRMKERRLGHTCPFCRESTPKSHEQAVEQSGKHRMKRIKANDPVAMFQEGEEQCKKANLVRAFEWYTKAAQLGDAEAHCKLAAMYQLGKGVEEDDGKQNHHLEEAAIGGHPLARCNLGMNEMINDNYERAVKHWIIAAAQGDDNSIKMLMKFFKEGFVKKTDLAYALRAHQTAVDATKSPQREAADEFLKINAARSI